jgi:hypothetical protein
MTQSTRPPNPLDDFDDSPPPGGGRRFAIALIVAAILLVGVVVGMYRWMEATSRVDYKGPEQLTYPEHRPYR